MRPTRYLFPLLSCGMAALATACFRNYRWDASTDPGLQSVMGRTYELLTPCYVMRMEDGAGLVPPRSRRAGDLPSENMEGYVGRRLGFFKVLGVMPAGSRFSVTRACCVANLATRSLRVLGDMLADDCEMDVRYLLDWERRRTPVLSPIAYFRPEAEFIRDVTAEARQEGTLARYLPHATKWKRRVR